MLGTGPVGDAPMDRVVGLLGETTAALAGGFGFRGISVLEDGLPPGTTRLIGPDGLLGVRVVVRPARVGVLAKAELG